MNMLELAALLYIEMWKRGSGHGQAAALWARLLIEYAEVYGLIERYSGNDMSDEVKNRITDQLKPAILTGEELTRRQDEENDQHYEEVDEGSELLTQLPDAVESFLKGLKVID